MRTIILPGDRRMRRIPLVAWGWAMLLVVLLSAAPTGAAPRTAVVGSAFDPATVSVVLSPKPSKLSFASAVQQQKRDARPSGSVQAIPALERAASAPPVALAAGRRAPDGSDPARLYHSFSRAHAPRAPPTH